MQMKANRVSDVIVVKNSKTNESLPGVHPMHVTVHFPTNVVRHPVETGQVVMDNKVIMPHEITVSIYLVLDDSYTSVYDNLLTYLDDTTGEKMCDIETKTNAWTNMILYDIVEKQTKDKYDVVEFDLKYIFRMDAKISEIGKTQGSSNTNNAKRDQNKPKTDSGIVKTAEEAISLFPVYALPGTAPLALVIDIIKRFVF